jgi:sRNA-binding protein
MTKKPRSDDEEFKVGNTVDLKSMSASLRKKGQPKSQKSKEDSAKKTIKTPRKKATFAPEDSKESGRNKEEEKVVPVSAQCVIGFAIRVDRGNNTKGGFNKKVSEGLTFLREFVDPAACILPNGKDERL